jgi:hypothetical protein
VQYAATLVQNMMVQDECSSSPSIVQKDITDTDNNAMVDMTITKMSETPSPVIIEKIDQTTTNETNCSSNILNDAQTDGDVYFLDDHSLAATQVYCDEDISIRTVPNRRSLRDITDRKLESIFEPEPQQHNGKNFLSSTEINMIGLPKTLSRDPMVLVQQLKKILLSVQNIRPLTPRENIMPGLKNFVGKSRNVKSKTVRNVCYFNALTFALSSCDSIISNALSYLKSVNPDWMVNVDLLQPGRKKPKSGTTVAPLIGREESSFVENFCNLLVAMRAQDLPRVFEEAINYREDRLILDPTIVLASFYTELGIPQAKQGV